MSVEDNKEIVRRYLEEVFHRRNSAAVDAMVAPDFVHHDPVNPIHGPEGLKQLQAVLFAAFPDLRITIEDMVAEGDRVVVRYTFTGTHRGDLAGIPPTGKAVRFTGIFIRRLRDGKAVDDWLTADTLSMLQQLGAIPAPSPAA
jgi:steroid delta-isomerase-like uncharacterized protein